MQNQTSESMMRPEFPYVYVAREIHRRGDRCRIVSGWRTSGWGSVCIEFEDGWSVIVSRTHIRRQDNGKSSENTAAGNDS